LDAILYIYFWPTLYQKLIYVCQYEYSLQQKHTKMLFQQCIPQQPVSLFILLFTVLYSHHFHVLGTLPLDYVLRWINPFHIWQCSYHHQQNYIIFYQRIPWLCVLTIVICSSLKVSKFKVTTENSLLCR